MEFLMLSNIGKYSNISNGTEIHSKYTEASIIRIIHISGLFTYNINNRILTLSTTGTK